MTFPNTDTRRLKRLSNDHFTKLTKAQLAKSETLCDSCGREVCPVLDTVETRLGNHISASINTCRLFQPVIPFSVVAGLKRSSWNTVRLGEAWSKRLIPGMSVSIADTKSEVLVREMKVRRTVVGTVQEICEQHAQHNHAILDRELVGQEASDALFKILRNAYGSNFAAPDRRATAIYLAAPDGEA